MENNNYNNIDDNINANKNEDTFEYFNIKEEIMRGIYSKNYDNPSLIQQKVFREMEKSSNIIIQSESSTGKTSAYVIYTLQNIDYIKSKDVQCLVLVSTRDTAQHICNLYREIGKYTKAKVYAFIGGSFIKDDIQKLSNGCQIVVSTPGRVSEMLNKKILSLTELKFFIIDEVDEILKRGFSECFKTINLFINDNCHIAVFNSTNVSLESLNSIVKIKNPVIISIDNDKELLIKNIKQYKISLKEEWKFNVLLNLYKLMEISQTIIFCNDKEKCNVLNENMTKKGFICSTLGDEKDKTISNFRKGYIRCLIVSDGIQSKEIDIYFNSLIINYDIPSSIDEYYFRVGRIEAFGKTGTVINFLIEKDNDIFNKIANSMPKNQTIDELPTELSIIDK